MSFVIEVLGDTGTIRSVHPDSVDFVEESDSTVLVGQVADLLDRRNTSAHRVNTLKRNELGRFLWQSSEFRLEVNHVVVLEDDLLSAGVTDSLNHRGVVERIGKDDTTGEFRSDGGETSIVGHVARREDKCGRLAVESRKLVFKRKVDGTVSSDVTGSSSPSAILVKSSPGVRTALS